jgi:hypothetical protein
MAEVKVKITAQNEVQTGLQASLAEVRQFAGQAQKEMQSAMQMPARQPAQERVAPTFKIDIGDYGLEPLRQMQEELKRVRQSAQEALDPSPAQDFAGGIGGVIGRFAILIGVAATVGKVIASAFDTLSNTVVAATKIQDQFAESLAKAGSQTTLSGAISYFENLQSLAEQTGETIDKNLGKGVGEALGNAVSGRPSQLFARIADAFTGLTGGDTVQKTLEKNQKAQQEQSLQSLRASLALQRSQAEQLAGAGGNPEKVDAVKRAQEVGQRRQDLAFALEAGKVSSADSAELKAELDAVIAAEDAAEAAQKRLEAEKEITREKERQQKLESGTRAGNVIGKQLGPGSFEGIEELNRERESVRKDAEQAAKEAERTQREADRKKQRADEFNLNTKLIQARALGNESAEESILQRQDLAKGQEATGNFDDAARFAAAAAALRDQQNQTTADAFGASSLQRIGGASTEFFRTGPRDPIEQQKKTNSFLAEILKEFKDKETLVLKNS